MTLFAQVSNFLCFRARNEATQIKHLPFNKNCDVGRINKKIIFF